MTNTEKHSILSLIDDLINYSSFAGEFPLSPYEMFLLAKLRKEITNEGS